MPAQQKHATPQHHGPLLYIMSMQTFFSPLHLSSSPPPPPPASPKVLTGDILHLLALCPQADIQCHCKGINSY